MGRRFQALQLSTKGTVWYKSWKAMPRTCYKIYGVISIVLYPVEESFDSLIDVKWCAKDSIVFLYIRGGYVGVGCV